MENTWEMQRRKARQKELLHTAGVWLLVIAVVLLFAHGCYGTRNIDAVKEHAPAVWKQAGFDVIGYEGYTAFGICYGDYGCGDVWHTLKRNPDNGIVYHGYIQRWGSEYHIYALSAIDAIKPQQK